MQLTVKLRQRRCQGDERHSNRYHGDDSVACHQPRSRHVGLVFESSLSTTDSDSKEYTGLQGSEVDGD